MDVGDPDDGATSSEPSEVFEDMGRDSIVLKPAVLAADDRRAIMVASPGLIWRLRPVLPVAIVSLAVHLAVVVLVARTATAPPPIPEQRETIVDLVQDPPPAVQKSAPEAAKIPDPEPPKPPAAVTAPATQPAPVADAPSAKPEPPKPPAAVTAPAIQPAPVADKPPAKPEPPETTGSDQTDMKTLRSLQAELAALKAQKAELTDEAAAAAEPAKELGPLPESFRAIALPAESIGGDESVSYQQEVFSRLAKAKKAGQQRVTTAGVAHVVFQIDTRGNLLDVTLDHPSGDAFLDGEAVATVRRAAPFPPPPQGALRSFSASMRFVVGD